MSRLIFIPQYPSKMRYQEWLSFELIKNFKEHFDDVIVLGQDVLYHSTFDRSESHMFSPINNAIEFEIQQVNEYMNMTIKKDDFLFLSDTSFPGFFCNALYHKRPNNLFAYCHATSKNRYDYFPKIKFNCETLHSKLFKKVFVGSRYHYNKIMWRNARVIGLPKPPFQTYIENKKYDIISVSRNCVQKVTKSIEKEISRDFSPIIRKEVNSWEEYYKFLSQSKCLFISAKEETFGYPVFEAIKNGCVPIAPNRCSYPELLPKEYLYNNVDEAKQILSQVLNGQLGVPELLNQSLVDNFFENLIREMKGE